jgi:hypothetical protein
MGWDIPSPLPTCSAPRPSPDYIVARNNGIFAFNFLEAASVCDSELGLSLPMVGTKMDMFQILANVTPLVDGLFVPVGNNIEK